MCPILWLYWRINSHKWSNSYWNSWWFDNFGSDQFEMPRRSGDLLQASARRIAYFGNFVFRPFFGYLERPKSSSMFVYLLILQGMKGKMKI